MNPPKLKVTLSLDESQMDPWFEAKLQEYLETGTPKLALDKIREKGGDVAAELVKIALEDAFTAGLAGGSEFIQGLITNMEVVAQTKL